MGVGLASWGLAALGQEGFVHAPAQKIMGGLMIVMLGYIHLELELLRHEKGRT